ncbi:hypothetical protein [Chengkuizengella axinellae]|uniref:DUF3139 domain-containing protein n=1 Tax=Chengkuizengella axinellae TaxID=3064388 RepID=A0ABT9J6I9_9BACL|nr:hypothetical protein [Chengkuizengella sp. 2205SS18-9]MDP5277236.1 hypothetical protein [Chengkuizengella sp. 2205SS18-9]
MIFKKSKTSIILLIFSLFLILTVFIYSGVASYEDDSHKIKLINQLQSCPETMDNSLEDYLDPSILDDYYILKKDTLTYLVGVIKKSSVVPIGKYAFGPSN